MQDLNKDEEGLRHRACKIKSKKEKLQHMFQIDPDISVDKNINEQVGQLEEP